METVKGILGGEGDFGRKKCKVEGQRRARDWVVVSFVNCDVDLGRRRWRRGRSIEERQG